LQNEVRIAKTYRRLFPNNKIFLFVACNRGQLLLLKKDINEKNIAIIPQVHLCWNK